MLSGRQSQRRVMARVILRKPAILILDEATSALNTNAEQAIQATLDSLASGATRLTITHRLSTIRTANIIFVMEKGKVIENGNHAILLNQKGLYANLWEKQGGNSGDECHDLVRV